MQPLKTVYVSYDGQPSSISFSYRIASNSDSWKFVNLSSRMFIRENKVIMQKKSLFDYKINKRNTDPALGLKLSSI